MVNITGGCHCGAIRYQVEGEPIVHALCHCADCRCHAGAPMVGWSMYAEDALKVTKGTPKSISPPNMAGGSFLCRLRHGPVLHQRKYTAGHRRYSERDVRRPRRRAGNGAYPDRRTAPLDGARPRTADLRALSAAGIANPRGSVAQRLYPCVGQIRSARPLRYRPGASPYKRRNAFENAGLDS